MPTPPTTVPTLNTKMIDDLKARILLLEQMIEESKALLARTERADDADREPIISDMS